MATRMQQRRGTATQWSGANPVLNAGEIGWESDTNKFKIGDGTNHWNDLAYFLDGDSISLTLGDYVETSTLAQPDGVATLDANGKLEAAQLPDVAQVTVHAVANQAARLALSVQVGDIAIQSDNGQTYVLSALPASTNANWTAITVADPFPSKDTDDLVEGSTNKYYTDSRAREAISANGGLDYNSTTGEFAADLGLGLKFDDNGQIEINTDTVATNTSVSSAISMHSDQTTNIHGVSGNVAGTSDVQTLTNKTLGSGTTLSANLSANNNKITDLSTPVNASDAATKAYVDSVAEGLHIHASVVALAASNVSLPTAPTTVDGVTLALNNRVLLIGQTAKAENGIYVVINGDLARAADYNTAAEIDAGDFVFVSGGTTYGNTGWVQKNSVTTLGTDPIEFTQFSGSGTYTDGFGLTLTGTQFAIDTDVTATKTYVDEQIDILEQLGNDTLSIHVETTTSVHGITNTANLVYTDDVRLSDERVPLDSSVTMNKIDDLAVVTSKIENEAVTEAKLADNSVSTIKIQDAAITSSKIALEGVSTVNLEDLSVTTDKIADSNITADKINSNAVTEAKIATGAVTELKIADGSVTGTKIASGTITNANISTVAAIAPSKIDGTAVVDNDPRLSDTRTPTDNTVNTNKIVDLAVTADKIADSAVTSSKIANNAVSTTAILDGSVTDDKIASGISQSKITNLSTDLGLKAPLESPTFTGTVTLPAGTVTSGVIANGTIVNEDISATAAIALSKLATDPLARANHTGTQAASTISNFDTQVRTSRLDQMSAPTSSVSMNSQRITNLAAPTDASDAATKAYVDGVSEGLHIHEAARVYAAANINLSNQLEAGDTIDGVTLVTGDRVLVNGQTTQSQNGIYVVQASGAAVRALDFDTPAEVASGDFVFVSEGTVYGNTGWVQTRNVGTVGTDPISFTQFSGAGTYVAGTGLSLNGSTFSINTTTTVDVATEQTLSNKTINLASNTLSGTRAQFNAALSDGDFATVAGTETLTNKTINLANNTLSGTTAEFNAALSDGDFATVAGTQTLTNKTLTSPSLTSPAMISPSVTSGALTLSASGVTFSDGTTQVSAGVPSITTITQRTASHTLGNLNERDTIIEISSASATTLTIPADATLNFPVGTTLDIIRTGSGAVAIAGASGVTVNATPGLNLRAQWSSATLLKRAANTWLVYGDLAV